MTKLKTDDKTVECNVCNREQTVNICDMHRDGKEPCYYCHLIKEHISEYKPEKAKDNTPTKIDSKKGNINDIFKDDTKKDEKPFKTLKQMRDETNEAIDKNKKPNKKDDDGGIYS